MHSLRLYSVAFLEDWTVDTSTQYTTQSNYPGPEETSLSPILQVCRTPGYVGTYFNFVCHWFHSIEVRTHNFRHGKISSDLTDLAIPPGALTYRHY